MTFHWYFYVVSPGKFCYWIFSRWKGSGSLLNDSSTERNEGRRSKEAAWEEISTLKQKIREFSTRNPLVSPANRMTEKRSPQFTTTSPKISATSAYGESICYVVEDDNFLQQIYLGRELYYYCDYYYYYSNRFCWQPKYYSISQCSV